MVGEVKQESIGSLSKGSYIVLEGAACRIADMEVSRPGKHGHAKVRVTAVGLIDGKKRVTVMPGHDNVDVPIVGKKTAQILSISGKMANVMDSETYETFDLEIPDELKADVAEGKSILYWEILDSKVMKQIKSD
ncbi:translation initiation factor IF-5A [Candidatus Woesearchaeota archaeon]|nr:translation initiation factor IF-5A [Candidatus Woesearchaeota archaeon]